MYEVPFVLEQRSIFSPSGLCLRMLRPMFQIDRALAFVV